MTGLARQLQLVLLLLLQIKNMKKLIILIVLLYSSLAFGFSPAIQAVLSTSGSILYQQTSYNDATQISDTANRFFTGQSGLSNAGTQYAITRVDAILGAPSGTITGKTYKCYIFVANGDNLGALIGESDGVTGSQSWSNTSVTFTFPTPAIIPRALSYAVVFSTYTTVDGSNYTALRDKDSTISGWLGTWTSAGANVNKYTGYSAAITIYAIRSGENIIANGSFESGATTPDNWNINSGSLARTADPATSSPYSYCTLLTRGSDGDAFAQDLNIDLGRIYLFGGWFRNVSATSGKVDIYDNNWVTAQSSPTITNSSWEFDGVITYGLSKTMHIYVVCNGSASNQFKYDDFFLIPTSRTSILTNGDMESSLSGNWTTVSANSPTVAQSTEQVNSGTYSTKITRGTGDDGAYQAFTTVYGRVYKVGGFARNGNAGTAVSVSIYSGTYGSGSLVSQFVYASSTTGWTQATYNLTASTTAYYILLKVIGTQGTYGYFDDIFVVQTSAY